MANMQPGTFRAHIINYTISETKAGNPQVEVLFEYTDGPGLGGNPFQIRWWGQLSEKSMSYTMKALLAMGYTGQTDEDFAKLADGVEGGMLDLGKEVDLVLEEETKEDGKKFIKIRWINDPDRAPQATFKNGLSRSEARVKLGALNLAGQMAMIRQQLGDSKPAPKATPPKPAQGGHDDVDFDFGPI